MKEVKEDNQPASNWKRADLYMSLSIIQQQPLPHGWCDPSRGML